MRAPARLLATRLSCRTALAAALTWPILVAAQAVLPPRAPQAEQFVPEGWVLEQKQIADLNRDGRADALLLMRRDAQSGTPERLLAVVLQGRGGGYELVESNQRLVPRSDDPNQEDPMADGEMVVRPGGFDIKFTLLSGAGSYLTAAVRYRFRRQNGCFRLIGYDWMETHRATLDTRDLSVNFLTAAVVVRTGNAQSEANKEQREKLKTNPRRCLRDLDSAATFDPR